MLVTGALAGGCTGIAGAPDGRGAGGLEPGSGPGTTTATGPGGFKPVPLLRITTLQYNNTLHDLFPATTLPAQTLPKEVEVGGFTNNARAQAPSPDLIEQLANNANAVATLVTADPAKLLPCKADTKASELPCGHAFIDAFAPKAFRRTLDGDDTKRLYALFDGAYAAYGFKAALRMVVEAVLQSPQLIYLVEEGTLQPDGRYALTSFELASRMSYFLWNTMPDDALRASAASGKLNDAAELDAQIARMLEDPRTHEAVARFHEQWLRFDKFQGLAKDVAVFPKWNDATGGALRDATARYVDYVFWTGGNLRTFLTDDHGYVTDALAWIYGVAAPGSATPKLMELDGTQRSGVITQPGLMAAFAHQTVDAPILRGVFVRERLMCLGNGTPPPGTPTDTPPPSVDAKTTRQRIEKIHVSKEPCISCHQAIDGVGFGFEHYDAVGAWRTIDNGEPVDATGSLVSMDDGSDGPFDGAIELGKKLAASSKVQKCVATQWARYALGLDKNEINLAMANPIATSFIDAKLDFRQLLVAIIKSDAFRLRVRLP